MKNIILITINIIMVIILIISVCCIDSDTNVFFFTALGSIGYLALSAYANGVLEL